MHRSIGAIITRSYLLPMFTLKPFFFLFLFNYSFGKVCNGTISIVCVILLSHKSYNRVKIMPIKRLHKFKNHILFWLWSLLSWILCDYNVWEKNQIKKKKDKVFEWLFFFCFVFFSTIKLRYTFRYTWKWKWFKLFKKHSSGR